ncbi:hypothetical protein ABEB36_009231 [Hypothenemus hampei]|uniref:THAP-type domain-containing protein n=1 Tax=Hypothenemus hampei TaxID=57062 RepID=A0ABD1EQ12_HYPHA
MVKSCFICLHILKKTIKRNGNYFLYSFPTDQTLCAKWKTLCYLDENDNVKNLHICNLHFTPECFIIQPVVRKGKIFNRLKPFAIPTILQPMDENMATTALPSISTDKLELSHIDQEQSPNEMIHKQYADTEKT